MASYQVEGKVALITGGAGGVGLAIAQELLKNNILGIALVDLKASEGSAKLEANNSNVIFLQADVTDKKQLEDSFLATVKRFKQLDIVVNNAAIADEFDWELTLAINIGAVIRGSYLAIQEYLPKYKSADSEGVVVNVASIGGVESFQGSPTYCCTKSAVINFSRSVAGEEWYKKYNVRVLAILPGVTRTPIITPRADGRYLIDPAVFKREFLGLNEVIQSAENVGRGVVHALRVGRNGSMWVPENDEPAYEIAIPNRKDLAVE